jgi:hypothetical protein
MVDENSLASSECGLLEYVGDPIIEDADVGLMTNETNEKLQLAKPRSIQKCL